MARSGPDDGQRAQALLEKGAGLYEEGKLYEAISCWRKVLQIDPDNEIAAEYLRFIEDNFQIGIDAFLEHHEEPGAAARETFDGDDDDLAAAIDDSINAMLDESIEELDWTELLEDGVEPEEPPPPSEVAEADEAFFPELGPGSLEADPGTEAEAWGRSLRSRPVSGNRLAGAEASLEMMPDGDPFRLPTDRFAVPYAEGELDLEFDDFGADPALDDAADAPAAGSIESGPPADERRRAAPDSPRASGEGQRRDLADMSEDSIDSMLDEDFKAWDQKAEAPIEPIDSFEELPFESPHSNPPAGIEPAGARPAQPPLDARGAPVERRRAPAPEGDWPSGDLAPELQRHTGPLDPVDPRLRVETGVVRAARTTPPTPMRLPPEAMPSPSVARPASTPPPLPPEALAPRPSAPPASSEGVPPASASGERRPARTPASPSASGERRQARAPASPSASGERRPASAARAPAPAPSGERRPAAASAPVAPARGQRRAAERPAPAPSAPATDLDDELRAILTAGIAEIESVEQPAGEGRPRQLISAPPPGTDLDALMVDARRRQQADDFSGALELVEQVLAGDPDHAEARRYLEDNTGRLLAMYRARLGSLGRVPRVRLRQQEIVWQSLDHREGFILSQVDGRTSFEEIIDISGMGVLESTRILARLVDHGVIG